MFRSDNQSNSSFRSGYGAPSFVSVDKDGKPVLNRTRLLNDLTGGDYLNRMYLSFVAGKNSRTNYDELIRPGMPDFHVVCKLNLTDSVHEFLELGQDPNCRCAETGNSPLHVSKSQYVMELLLRNGADPNLVNKDGSTPMHIVCNNYTVDLLGTIFEHCWEKYQPLQVNARDKSGNTPLHLILHSARYSVESMTESLLRRGADPTLANEKGSTPLHVICTRNIEYLSGEDLMEIFLKTNKEIDQMVEINALDNLGRTPLQCAVASLQPKCVKLLLDHGAELSSFVFPTENYFRAYHSKLLLVSCALDIVERLQEGGYELARSDALTIMKLFAKRRLFEKRFYYPTLWYNDEKFVSIATELMVKPDLSLHKLVHLQPKEAKKLVTYLDYVELVKKLYEVPGVSRYACAAHLSDILMRGFLRPWALECFMELTHYRLPILCCAMIIEELNNEDLYNICLAIFDDCLFYYLIDESIGAMKKKKRPILHLRYTSSASKNNGRANVLQFISIMKTTCAFRNLNSSGTFSNSSLGFVRSRAERGRERERDQKKKICEKFSAPVATQQRLVFCKIGKSIELRAADARDDELLDKMMSVYANDATKTLLYEPQHEEQEETPVEKPPMTLETIALDDSTDEVIEDNAVTELEQSLEMAMAPIKSVPMENIDASKKFLQVPTPILASLVAILGRPVVGR
ncbi:unnamed protein product [Trichogramma brassicae]|uniref:Uncharacterized protein n=1 Tax=Trichogramma brassicae TaxID=86971 RepID=A0A6H5I7D3_9HYME|nr:unnamed protein product [Trichogramma brassicae]